MSEALAAAGDDTATACGATKAFLNYVAVPSRQAGESRSVPQVAAAGGALGLLDDLRGWTDAIRLKRVTVLLVIALAAVTSLAAAGIRPADQKLAECLTLNLSDFPSGWTTNGPASTRLEKTQCATAPKVEDAISGYSDSAGFVPVRPDIDKRSAGSTTRLFSSVPAARAWYAWLADGRRSACALNAAVASWKRNRRHFKVSRLRHVRETFLADCSSCPAHQVSAWRWGFTISKQGQNDTTYVFDDVGVRMKRVVISFAFFSVDSPFGHDGQRLVSNVLERG